jgi:cell division protein ZapA
MANVNIKFNGKEFLLSCDDGQEEHLEELSIYLNQKFDDLKSNLGNIGENKLLLITSIKIMDEYFETKKKIDQRTIELKELTAKFKELKSLIYDYKNKKENEISELNKLEKNLKTQIDENKSEYEKILDEATEKIEDFLKKTNINKPLQ